MAFAGVKVVIWQGWGCTVPGCVGHSDSARLRRRSQLHARNAAYENFRGKLYVNEQQGEQGSWTVGQQDLKAQRELRTACLAVPSCQFLSAQFLDISCERTWQRAVRAVGLSQLSRADLSGGRHVNAHESITDGVKAVNTGAHSTHFIVLHWWCLFFVRTDGH